MTLGLSTQPSKPRLLASVELGGTKTIVAVAEQPQQILFRERFETTDPQETLDRVVAALAAAEERHGKLAGVGIASFGPIRIDPDASDWGELISTPKPHWSGCSIGALLRDRLDLPVVIDTDVNAAAMAEALHGAGQGCADLAYVTVGTGIGGGLVLGGQPRRGLLHPEVGHILVRRHPEDHFAGLCPYHGDCLEGLASGPAIKARLGAPLDSFGPDHPFRPILADYLAQLCLNLTLVASVKGIVIGGGVMQRLGLLPDVQHRMRTLLGGYIEAFNGGPSLSAPMFEDAGLIGGFLLAERAVRQGAPNLR